MKALSVLALVLMTSSALATPRYNARTSTCSELQQALESYGEISIRSKNLLIVRHTVVSENPRCHVLSYKKEARFRTKDSISCHVGFTCEDDHELRGDCFPGNNPSRCN